VIVLRVVGYALLAFAPSVIALALFLAAARAGTQSEQNGDQP
jgi:hypothetical protein